MGMVITPVVATLATAEPETMPIKPEEMTEEQMAEVVDAFLLSQESAAAKEMLIGMYNKYISSGSYDDNLVKLGVVSVEAPSSIAIYADSFENKEKIEAWEQQNK